MLDSMYPGVGYTTPLFAHTLSGSYNLMPALHPLMCDTTSWRNPDDGENTLRSLLYPTRFAQKGDTATRFSPALLWRNRVAVSTFWRNRVAVSTF